MPIVGKMKGDLVALANAGLFDMVVHGANCQNTMNSGIAKQFRKVWPQCYEADCKTVKGDENKLGSYTLAYHHCRPNRQFAIVNLYTQFNYGYEEGVVYLDYDALEKGFSKLNRDFGVYANDLVVGIPKIGAGKAHGDWDRIEQIINRVTNLSIFLVDYEENI